MDMFGGCNSRIRLYTGVTLDNPAGPKCGAEAAYHFTPLAESDLVIIKNSIEMSTLQKVR
jgi:hypothetical protein